jgi:hypothetical protein
VQVVEVLGGPLDVGGQHLFHAGLGEGRVHVHFVLGEGGQAFGVHPALHDEGPEVEGYLLGGWVSVCRFFLDWASWMEKTWEDGMG